MSRSIFGWDLPPGCSIGDIERHFGGGDPSPESEKVYELLENAECDQDLIDKVCDIVDGLAAKAYADCPQCERRADEAAAEAMREDFGCD